MKCLWYYYLPFPFPTTYNHSNNHLFEGQLKYAKEALTGDSQWHALCCVLRYDYLCFPFPANALKIIFQEYDHTKQSRLLVCLPSMWCLHHAWCHQCHPLMSPPIYCTCMYLSFYNYNYFY
jgi:hypothetical protein